MAVVRACFPRGWTPGLLNLGLRKIFIERSEKSPHRIRSNQGDIDTDQVDIFILRFHADFDSFKQLAKRVGIKLDLDIGILRFKGGNDLFDTGGPSSV